MCTRYKTAFACNHRLPFQIERCNKADCDRLIKVKDVIDEDCDHCYAQGESCTRGRDGFGPHARRIRKEKEKARLAKEREQNELESRDSVDSTYPDPVGPWLKTFAGEHKWEGSKRRKSDADWVREHERRRRRSVPGAVSTISSVNEQYDNVGVDDILFHEIGKLQITEREQSVDNRDRHRRYEDDGQSPSRRPSHREDEYAEYYRQQERWQRHRQRRPSHTGTFVDHYGNRVYDTGLSGPINPYQTFATTNPYLGYSAPIPHSPVAYGSQYSSPCSYGEWGSWGSAYGSPGSYVGY